VYPISVRNVSYIRKDADLFSQTLWVLMQTLKWFISAQARKVVRSIYYTEDGKTALVMFSPDGNPGEITIYTHC